MPRLGPLYEVVHPGEPAAVLEASHEGSARRVVRSLVVLVAVSQLAVAMVLALGREPDPVSDRGVAVVVPTQSVQEAAATTTTTMPPVVVELPRGVPAPPAPPTTVARGAVSGTIGAGAGGRARADLYDEAGNQWHSEADSQGNYRFDGLPPGRYQLILAAESAPAPCPPEGPCVGTALSVSKRIIDIRPGAELREDYAPYGPTGPATTTTTAAPAVEPPATTTTTVAASS